MKLAIKEKNSLKGPLKKAIDNLIIKQNSTNDKSKKNQKSILQQKWVQYFEKLKWDEQAVMNMDLPIPLIKTKKLKYDSVIWVP